MSQFTERLVQIASRYTGDRSVLRDVENIATEIEGEIIETLIAEGVSLGASEEAVRGILLNAGLSTPISNPEINPGIEQIKATLSDAIAAAQAALASL